METLYRQPLEQPAAALREARRIAAAEGMAESCWAAWTLHAAPG